MPRRLSKPAAPTSVEAVRHTGESRVNIPTAELEGLAAADEQGPKTIRYPRDPSLDPQLVWKGKEEQDGRDLEVPAVPIYIQERSARRRSSRTSAHRPPPGARRSSTCSATSTG